MACPDHGNSIQVCKNYCNFLSSELTFEYNCSSFRNCKQVVDRFTVKKAPGLNTDKNIQEPPQAKLSTAGNPIDGMCLDLNGTLAECLKQAFSSPNTNQFDRILIIVLDDFLHNCKNGKLLNTKSYLKI